MELKEYVKQMVEDFTERANLALGVIDRERVPLYVADPVLYGDISDAMMQWCDDYDKDCSDYDAEDMIW